MMKASDLAFVAFVMSGAINNPDFRNRSSEEVRIAIMDGSIFSFFEEGDMKIEIAAISPDMRRELIDMWRDIVEVDIDSKLCRTDDGLALLANYTTHMTVRQAREEEELLEHTKRELTRMIDEKNGVVRMERTR